MDRDLGLPEERVRAPGREIETWAYRPSGGARIVGAGLCARVGRRGDDGSRRIAGEKRTDGAKTNVAPNLTFFF